MFNKLAEVTFKQNFHPPCLKNPPPIPIPFIPATTFILNSRAYLQNWAALKLILKQVCGYFSFALEHPNPASLKHKPNYLHPSRWVFQAPLFPLFSTIVVVAGWCFTPVRDHQCKASRAFSSSLLHVTIFSNLVQFCSNFQLFCPFLPFFWKITRMP